MSRAPPPYHLPDKVGAPAGRRSGTAEPQPVGREQPFGQALHHASLRRGDLPCACRVRRQPMPCSALHAATLFTAAVSHRGNRHRDVPAASLLRVVNR